MTELFLFDGEADPGWEVGRIVKALGSPQLQKKLEGGWACWWVDEEGKNEWRGGTDGGMQS